MPLISVLMPTFKQAPFIRRAIRSLLAQSLTDWELLVVDDGSPDDTLGAIQPYLHEARLRYSRLEANMGLGAALNLAIERSEAPLVAYLPSDDVYYADHLASLAALLETNPGAVLAYSGVRHHYNRESEGQIEGYPLQLIQVSHRRVPHRWVERAELVTDDLERMFWGRLSRSGEFVASGRVTCEWVDHPQQRHKLLREPVGGIHPYRLYYGVREPLRFHSTVGNPIDEVERYRSQRQRPATPPAPDGLKILLVGELAYNADRVLALEERGHRLFGLWLPQPYWYNTVGPLPFGHVQDLPLEGWREEVRRIRPDVIYALLNWQAVPFARRVLAENPGIPFVWHFKESPFICLEKGSWPELVELYQYSDGQVFSSSEMRAWFETVVPPCAAGDCTLVLDGDLPKREWFTEDRSPLLSRLDGEFHTVVPGRPIGLHPPDVAALARQGIHLHFYGDFTHGQWKDWIATTERLAAGYIHLHGHVDQDRWTAEFSQYDAGWLHAFASRNGGEILRANWDDLNLPARIPTLIAAGLPLLQRESRGHLVAAQNLARQLEIGLFFSDVGGLRALLEDRERMAILRENVWNNRYRFTFDFHADRLIEFFRQVIDQKGGKAAGLRSPLTTQATIGALEKAR